MGGIPHPSGGWKTSPLKSPAGFLRALDAVKGQVDSCSVTTILRCLALRKINRLPSDVVSGKVFIRAYMEDMDVRRRLMNLKQLTSLMGCRLAKQVAPACDWVINEMKWMDPMPIWHTPSLPTLNPTHFNDLAVVSHVNQAAFLPAFLKSVVPLRTLTLDFDDRCYVRDYKRCLEGKYLPMADPKTEATFAVLHAVRDIYARRLDEGPTWLLPTSVLAVLSREGPTTEEEVEEIYRSCAKEAGPPDLPSRMKSMVVLSILWAQANLICSEAAPAPQKTPISHYRPFKSMQEYLDCLETFPQKIRDQVALMPPEKRPRFLKYSERFAAQKAVYENFQILSPNGSLLCHCDRKKVDWYLRKNLAQTIDATSIQLKFEPAARSLHAEVDLPDGAYSDGIVSCENGQLAVDAAAVIEKIGEHKLEQWKADLYYVSKKDNHCVVCGVTQHFLRFHVIPSCYRQHFPEAYKSHGSHDVVLLCVACHQTANDKYQIMKAQLSLEYHVPLQTPPPPENRLRSEARKALHALKRPQIPPHRREELRGRVVVWVQANQQLLDENLSPEDKTMDGIPEAAHRILSLPEQQSPSISHGEAMVVAVASDIDVFIKRWRKYFLDVLEPGFMPVNWTVEHKCARHFGEHSTFNPNKPTNDTGGPVDLLDEFKNEQAELPSAG
ncbi:MAG: uncharacterized protein KVP18_002282 [Porospora cf. gigantea A]|nr:MAG: hypothetical protein KVP18_002282 [Porospora cf. gigantea A]